MLFGKQKLIYISIPKAMHFKRKLIHLNYQQNEAHITNSDIIY